MSEEEMRAMFGDGDPFSDFFHTFFGGAGGGAGPSGRGRRRKATQPGRDVEHELELTLEEAAQGVTRRFETKHGGQVRTVDVRIPAGVSDGSRVRVGGEGEHGMGGGKSGDLYLRIRLLPHRVFERKGRDLYVSATVPLTTAVLGGEVEVKTLLGKSLRLKIPAPTQNNQVFRLKGHGMPGGAKSTEVGDLYATVTVQLPAALTPEQRVHFEALRKLEGRAHDSTARGETI
jgi:DnaJ-class molecular chaperone